MMIYPVGNAALSVPPFRSPSFYTGYKYKITGEYNELTEQKIT